jgi:hypothetical protein
MKTFILILLCTPWLLVGAVAHGLLLAKVRTYRDFFEYRALRRDRAGLVQTYGQLPQEVFVAVQKSVMLRLRRRGDVHTNYGKMYRDIFLAAYEIQLSKEENV